MIAAIAIDGSLQLLHGLSRRRADSQRVALVGWGYGGFLAASAALQVQPAPARPRPPPPLCRL